MNGSSRRFLREWVCALFDLSFLKCLRLEEIQRVLPLLSKTDKILEVGAGTGEQAKFLAEQGFDVTAIDLPSSGYSSQRVFRVVEYDGQHIPMADSSVDLIFSSNVLEHVEDLPSLLREFARVSRRGGYGIHLMPTTSWRFWTFVTGLPTAVVALCDLVSVVVNPPREVPLSRAVMGRLKTIAGAIIPIGHGTSIEGLSELWTFSSEAWKARFRRNGMVVDETRPIGLFYTGHMLFGSRLRFKSREKLSRLLGSGTRIYVVRSASE